MKAGTYAVSVQHGASFHYFIWTGENQQEAIKITTDKNKLFAKKKKGIKPVAMAWTRT